MKRAQTRVQTSWSYEEQGAGTRRVNGRKRSFSKRNIGVVGLSTSRIVRKLTNMFFSSMQAEERRKGSRRAEDRQTQVERSQTMLDSQKHVVKVVAVVKLEKLRGAGNAFWRGDQNNKLTDANRKE